MSSSSISSFFKVLFFTSRVLGNNLHKGLLFSFSFGDWGKRRVGFDVFLEGLKKDDDPGDVRVEVRIQVATSSFLANVPGRAVGLESRKRVGEAKVIKRVIRLCFKDGVFRDDGTKVTNETIGTRDHQRD